MGLDTSHNCWHGSYSSFHRWRCMIAQEAGLPPLGLMEGFYEFKVDLEDVQKVLGVPPWLHALARSATQNIPIPWCCLKDSALHELLNHSDCDGELINCAAIADALEELMLEDERTKQFVAGLRLAAANNERVIFA